MMGDMRQESVERRTRGCGRTGREGGGGIEGWRDT